eukprot:38613-Chlamydomonas_euryale.AAC.8
MGQRWAEASPRQRCVASRPNYGNTIVRCGDAGVDGWCVETAYGCILGCVAQVCGRHLGSLPTVALMQVARLDSIPGTC